MLQLTQVLKSGDMNVQEMPLPALSDGQLLVRNHYSLISAGTEGSTVKTARKSLIGKAKERPEQVRQVVDTLKKQGPVQTYRAVMKKLDAYSPLGYSSAGVVESVSSGVTGFKVGDRVACAGVGYANHAEYVAVPVNLCVKLDDNADLAKACYNTLGAIALQGIRQADLRLGESCCVIGLGLLGQLTCLMLRASGVRTVGVDVSAAAVETAAKHCADLAVDRSAGGCADQITGFSGGQGVDAVIITAGTDSLDPINFAGSIARKKGCVVVVGAVPTGFDRDPHYYRKELELRMSCSYGPGRYDPAYEEKGLDYPVAYVRWTENRNMTAFQDLVQRGAIDTAYLTTHTFAFTDAPRAYDLIVGNEEPHLGVVLAYDTDKPTPVTRIEIAASKPVDTVGLSFIGAGSYAQGNLLPNLPDDPAVVRRGVLTRSGTTSKRVAEKYGFAFCTSDAEEVLSDADTNTVFIATRHDSHADYVLKSLERGKHVFVEKPLCLTADELETISASLTGQKNTPSALMVGFNRRFAPLVQTLKSTLGQGPMSMLYRINAGAIPADSWIQDPALGGGRIVGEVCHFIDLLTYMCGALPVSVYANAIPDPDGLDDTLAISVAFANGSIGTISYFANGAKSVPKEYVEVYSHGTTGIIHDFKTLEIHGGGRPERQKLLNQNKGQGEMVGAFLNAIRDGRPCPIPFDEVIAVTRATLAARDSIASGTVSL